MGDGRLRGEDDDEIDRIGALLIAEWERVERKPVNVSCIATFADMARVVLADRKRQDADREAAELAKRGPVWDPPGGLRRRPRRRR